MQQLAAGKLTVDMEAVTYPDLRVRRFSVSQALSMEAFFPKGWTSFILCTEQNTQQCTWCGIPVQTHTLAIMSDQREHHYKLPANWQNVDIAVANTTLVEEGLIPPSLLTRIANPENGHLVLPAENALRLNDFLLGLIDQGSKGRVNTRQVILNALAEAMELSLTLEQNLHSNPEYERFSLVRKIEQYAAMHPSRVIHAQQVYDDLSLNRRRVERAFRQVLDISPYRYFLNTRLQAARHKLINPNEDASITDIATQFGFASSSEFTRNYKAFYDEKPSESLRKR